MRRTVGLNLIGLGFLAVAVGTVVVTERVRTSPAELAQLGVAPTTMVGLGLFAGLTAAAAGVGVWTRGEWLRVAIVLWGLGAAGLMLVVQHAQNAAHEPLWMVLLPYVALVLVIGIIMGYTGQSV